MNQSLSYTQVRKLISYDPETGDMRRLESHKRPDLIGRVAGSKTDRYCKVRIHGIGYFAHRLAWLYMTGAWPDQNIDHIDGNGQNNRWINLRLATQSQNLANARTRTGTQSGMKGVYYDARRDRWYARVKNSHIGCFSSKEEAIAAYASAARRIFGEYARP